MILLLINKLNDLILNLTRENMTQHSRIEWQLHTKEAQHPSRTEKSFDWLKHRHYEWNTPGQDAN